MKTNELFNFLSQIHSISKMPDRAARALDGFPADDDDDEDENEEELLKEDIEDKYQEDIIEALQMEKVRALNIVE